MKNIIEYALDGEDFIAIEVDGGLATRSINKTKLVNRATITFSEVIEKVVPVTNTFVTKFKKQEHKPDEIAIEFGLKLGGKADIAITSMSAEAHFKVVIKWTNRNK